MNRQCGEKEWPKQIHDVFVKYFRCFGVGHLWSDEEKEALVKELIEVYNNLSKEEQAKYIVPAKGRFLKPVVMKVDHDSSSTYRKGDKYDNANYSLLYKWPANDGFVVGSEKSSLVEKGKKYDRIGDPRGRYLCPFKENGEPETYYARAIPYYIPDEEDIKSSPAYHVYIAISSYQEEGEEYPKLGTIATAFRKNPDDGGGKQLVFTKAKTVGSLIGEVFINEDV